MDGLDLGRHRPPVTVVPVGRRGQRPPLSRQAVLGCFHPGAQQGRLELPHPGEHRADQISLGGVVAGLRLLHRDEPDTAAAALAADHPLIHRVAGEPVEPPHHEGGRLGQPA